MFRNNYFKECNLVAAFAIYFLKLYLLSRKQVKKSVGLLRKSHNVLPKTFKLFIRPHHDQGNVQR